jgi:23S rRNA pseudouridine2605 synthase
MSETLRPGKFRTAQSRGPGAFPRKRRRTKVGLPPKTAAASEPVKAPLSGERLQKVMAAAGIGSRRHCEELIEQGRVEVDRQTVKELGTRVNPHEQEIRVDGTLLTRSKLVYYMINKPVGILSTNDDPSGRPRVIDLLPPRIERLFTVGRLDMSSEGMMIVTNDGELANGLAHPRYGVEKIYHALVAGNPTPEVLEKLRTGIHLAEAFAKVVSVKVKNEFKQSALLEIVLNEGKNREIRRLLAKVGHKVLKLKRVAIGGVRLKELEPGQFRQLYSDELRTLREAARPAHRGRKDAGPIDVHTETKPQAADDRDGSDETPRESRPRPGKPRRRNNESASAPRPRGVKTSRTEKPARSERSGHSERTARSEKPGSQGGAKKPFRPHGRRKPGKAPSRFSKG